MLDNSRLTTLLAKQHTEAPTLSLQSYISSDKTPDLFRVVASHRPTQQALSLDDYAAMIAKLTGNNFSMVANSFEILQRPSATISHKNQQIITCLVAPNTISRPVPNTDEEKKQFRLLTANVFMDDENTIWKMIGEGDSKMLVRSAEEDYEQILKNRLARKNSMLTASAGVYHGDTPNVGDYIAYIESGTQELKFGFALSCDNKIFVLPRDARNSTDYPIIAQHQIVASLNLKDENDTQEITAGITSMPRITYSDPKRGSFNKVMVERYLSYMRILFKNTDYFRTLETYIKNALLNPDQPVTTMRS